jgi:hypothetical protein
VPQYHLEEIDKKQEGNYRQSPTYNPSPFYSPVHSRQLSIALSLELHPSTLGFSYLKVLHLLCLRRQEGCVCLSATVLCFLLFLPSEDVFRTTLSQFSPDHTHAPLTRHSEEQGPADGGLTSPVRTQGGGSLRCSCTCEGYSAWPMVQSLSFRISPLSAVATYAVSQPLDKGFLGGRARLSSTFLLKTPSLGTQHFSESVGIGVSD